MSNSFKVISPVDNSVYIERKYHTQQQIEETIEQARTAQSQWKSLSVDERSGYIRGFISAISKVADPIAEELAWQMGRPIRYGSKEVVGTVERAEGMMNLAKSSLQDIPVEDSDISLKYIKREPLGVVFVVPAWNYPYLIAVNSIVPGLLAGNAVILKHSAQTPLVAERFAEAFASAGLPEGLFQYLHLNHENTARVIRDPRINYVAFTGSVSGGHQMQQNISERFIGLGLELGGKDPAYVHADVNLDFAVENLVDGAFFNSGQSCCSIERIYVHEKMYDAFVDGFVDLTLKYKLGNPLDKETNFGPVAKPSVAETVKKQIAQALNKGARALVDPSHFAKAIKGETYFPPQVLVNVDHGMDVMVYESFGPVVGIMKVKNEAEAVSLMNDSPYGLTASVWTEDLDLATRILDQVNTGTCYLNKCDYLDPYLAWTGVKDTGRGCTLSQVGFEQLTRPKSYFMKK